MKGFVYWSPTGTKEAEQQRLERLVVPLLRDLMKNVPDYEPHIEVTADALLISGIAVGDWRLMSNFRIESESLVFDYDCKTRVVCFQNHFLSNMDGSVEFYHDF